MGKEEGIPRLCSLCGAPGVLVARGGPKWGWKWRRRDIGTQNASMPARAVHGEKWVMAAGLAAALSRAVPGPLAANPAGTRRGELCFPSPRKPSAVSIPGSNVTSGNFPQKSLFQAVRAGKQPQMQELEREERDAAGRVIRLSPGVCSPVVEHRFPPDTACTFH